MDYEIVATIGPASRSPQVRSAVANAGATAFRVNTSHLSVEELEVWLREMESAVLPIVLDLQGSKWRLGDCGPLNLVPGERVVLVHSDLSKDELPVPHLDFFRAAEVSDGTVLLNDAKVALNVEKTEPNRLEATVTRGGGVTSFKGITFAQSRFRTESLSDKDAQIVADTRNLSHVRYALSYVKDAAEMQRYRALIGSQSYLIAKLERPEAVAQAEEIAESANEMWLCRGDLGAELGLRDMAQAAYELSDRAGSFSVPVLLAGQVLEHMTEHETPTRAEVCSLYDALRAGYRGVVLSDETAIGRYPVESCRVAAMFR
jgi:pyruvate kinase